MTNPASDVRENDQDRFEYEVTRGLQEAMMYGRVEPAKDLDKELLEEAVAKLNEYMLELAKYGYVLKAGEDLSVRIVDRLFDKAAGK
jgi:hypothetical protein